MCLNIVGRKTPRSKYIGGGIYRAYKIFERKGDSIVSSYIQGHVWKLDGWNCADIEDGHKQSGFHVYPDRDVALSAMVIWSYFSSDLVPCHNIVVAEVHVRGFRGWGIIKNCDLASDGNEGEIWEEAKIVRPFITLSFEKLGL